MRIGTLGSSGFCSRHTEIPVLWEYVKTTENETHCRLIFLLPPLLLQSILPGTISYRTEDAVKLAVSSDCSLPAVRLFTAGARSMQVNANSELRDYFALKAVSAQK